MGIELETVAVMDWVPPARSGKFEFALQQGLKRSDTILPASDPVLRELITKLAFPAGALLAGLTQ